MTTRVSPSERIRAEIDELFASRGDLGDTLEEVARLGARLLLQSAIEGEVTEFLGRKRYERRDGAEEARPGSRNGYAPLTVKTTAGTVTLDRPKLRGTTEAFASRLLGAGVTRTNALESLVIAGFVRGLLRDVEPALTEALGPEATVSKSTVSKSTVSRVCETIKAEFDAWKHRSLADVELDYLLLDGSVRHEAPYDRVGWKGPPAVCRSKLLKLGAAGTWRRRGRREQPPTTTGRASTARWSGLGKQDGTGATRREPAVEPPQAREPAPTWRIWAG